MAGDWLKVEAVTPDKPEVMRVAKVLDVEPEAAFGHIFRVWAWVDQQSLDGHALSVTEKDIDRVARRFGVACAMREVGWIKGADGCLSFPKFERHNGESAKKRALARNRKVTQRSRKDGDKGVTRGRDREEVGLGVEGGVGGNGKTKRNSAPVTLPAWLNRDKWDAWVKIRPAKARTPDALKAAVEKLDGYRVAGHDPNAIVAESLANGWQGLFEPKARPAQGAASQVPSQFR